MEKLHSPVGKNNLHAYGSGSKVHNFILQQGLFGLLSLITRVLSVWAHCKVICGFYQHSGLYLQWGSDWKLLTLKKGALIRRRSKKFSDSSALSVPNLESTDVLTNICIGEGGKP